MPEQCGLFRPLKLLECSLSYYFFNCVAKVILYFYSCKYFSNYFQYIFIFLSFLALYLIIYNKAGADLAAVCFMVGIFTAGRGCRIWRPFVGIKSGGVGTSGGVQTGCKDTHHGGALQFRTGAGPSPSCRRRRGPSGGIYAPRHPGRGALVALSAAGVIFGNGKCRFYLPD